MKKYRYQLVDVFTDRAFGGNPLAVLTDARGLPAEVMQAIAKEFNLSETTFVLPPETPGHDFRVRIFTPGRELPMAGHPTVGTAFVLAREGMIKSTSDETTVMFEEGVGTIPVSLRFRNDAPDFVEMNQPLPRFGARFADAALIAEMLSLDVRDIETDLPIEVGSCGIPFLFVPLRSLSAARRCRVRLDVWEKALGGFETRDIFVFTREVEYEGSTVHSRMFAPEMGIGEDPATGSASGPLGCYLIRHKLFDSPGEFSCVSEQGVEMGRPSFIHVRVAHEAGEFTSVRVGGRCVAMGEGTLD
ncbi:MAG TPA: PhzF family phenazine biosynthesis protein, partial [Pyrinomonadaceae bacterium]|nr:PhzF family phenazine biosynthesis protein [Pyrinomonadaceae bacterium]